MANPEATARSKFVSGLRQLYRWYWPAKKEALGRARYRIEGERKYLYDCVECGKRLYVEDVEVDHIEDVGLQPDLVAGEIGAYCDRLFCGVENLQILCHDCHKIKTAAAGARNRQKRKELKFNFTNLAKEDLKCLTLPTSTGQADRPEKSKAKRSRGSKKTGKKRKSSV